MERETYNLETDKRKVDQESSNLVKGNLALAIWIGTATATGIGADTTTGTCNQTRSQTRTELQLEVAVAAKSTVNHYSLLASSLV